MYVIQQCSISAAPSDSTVPEVAGIEPRTVATLALIATHSARCQNKSDLRYDPGDPRCQPIYERRVYKRRNYKGDYWHTERYNHKAHLHIVRQPGGIGSLESIIGLLKSLKIRAQTENRFLGYLKGLQIRALLNKGVYTIPTYVYSTLATSENGNYEDRFSLCLFNFFAFFDRFAWCHISKKHMWLN
jgi:hypothetical protein